MVNKNIDASCIEVLPLTIERWHDCEKLFGSKGACGGCWCMYWRLRRKEFNASKGEGNKMLLRAMTLQGKYPPGLIMYLDHEPIGWCSLGPREDYPVLENSRILKRVDDQTVWSIVCFFMHKHYRKKGLSVIFLQQIIDYCKNAGANILEAYPVDPKMRKDYPATFAFTGFPGSFIKAGFTEVARRSPTRPVMRYVCSNQ